MLTIRKFTMLISFSCASAVFGQCPPQCPPPTIDYCSGTGNVSTNGVGTGWDLRPSNDKLPLPVGHFIPISRLGNHYMPDMPNFDGDSMTEPTWKVGDYGEAVAYARKFGSDGFHETWYIPKEAATGRDGFYERWGGSYWDHMDTADPNDGSQFGYITEKTLGYPWTSTSSGLSAIPRYFNSSIFDHRTWLPGVTPAGYYLETTFDATSPTPRFGFPRFGNRPCKSEVFALDGDTIANSRLTVTFNKVWGNAIRDITFNDGSGAKQIVVDDDIGSLVQAEVLAGVGWTQAPRYVFINPTEAGSADGGLNYGNTYRWLGSPVLSISHTATTEHTVLQPFNFDSSDFTYSEPDTTHIEDIPLLWKGYFTKDVTVGYTDRQGVTHDEVMQIGFDTVLQDPSVPTDTYGGGPNNNAPAGMAYTFWLHGRYLGDDGTTIHNYQGEILHLDTQVDTLIPVLPTTVSDSTANYPSDTAIMTDVMPGATYNTAAIVYKNDRTFAYGWLSRRAIHVPGCTTDGSIEGYFFSIGGPDAQSPINITLKASAHHNLTSAQHSLDNVFFVVGNYNTVRADLLAIYDKEVASGQCLAGP